MRIKRFRYFLLTCLCILVFLSSESINAGEVTIDWLWVNSAMKTGGVSRGYVTAEPNPKKKISVGIFESVAGGVGPMMSSAGWMAAVMASQILGIDLTNYKISYDIFGRVDGPSAGGLTTVAVMAAIQGDRIRDDFTMTGTINPDGTIGPVGGIPQKIQGAVRAGKKTVIIPYGSRYGYDLVTESMVDLIDLGHSLGANIIQARDIYEAYEHLTGKRLLKVRPKEDIFPDIPKRVFDRTRDAVRAWHVRYKETEAKYKLIPNSYKSQDIVRNMEAADALYKGSLDALLQGNISVAYGRAVLSFTIGFSGYLQADVIRTLFTLQGNPKEAVKNYIDLYRFSQERVNSFYTRLDSERISTLSDMVTLADTYAKVIQAKGCILLSQNFERSMIAIEKLMQDAAASTQESTRPALGITVTKSPYGQGLLVNAVVPNSLAFRAGILAGDIIYRINEYPVNSVSDVGELLQQTRIGDTLRFFMSRGNEQISVSFIYDSGVSSDQESSSPQQARIQQELLDRWFQKMFLTVMFYKMSEVSIELAQDRLNIGLGFGEKGLPRPEAVKGLATLFSVAADANMRNFESLFIEQEADKMGISLELARMKLMEEDLSFGLTYASYMGFINFPPTSDVARLGAGMELFYATSGLVTKYYSLMAEIDKFGNVVKVGQEQALINMLDLAVKNARQNIILAKESGSIPVWAQLYYEVGKYSREGNLNDKLQALISFWNAAAQSRAIYFLSGRL
ncbi:MAG: PDZ domain-containing protein [Deltaproteobacteria bacterium]|nr:PDZ domain-containing protein [Deltaproteobacteria bacterium]